MKRNIMIKYLLISAVGTIGAVADMTVDKSNGVLTITSDISGTVIAKIVGPDDKVIVDKRYEGNSFSWTPSGVDGAYRYDVRVAKQKASGAEESDSQDQNDGSDRSNYVGGSVEVVDGALEQDETPIFSKS